MNIILFPTRPRKNPNWLLRLARRYVRLKNDIADYCKFVSNYLDYRQRGISHKEARHLARNVIDTRPR